MDKNIYFSKLSEEIKLGNYQKFLNLFFECKIKGLNPLLMTNIQSDLNLGMIAVIYDQEKILEFLISEGLNLEETSRNGNNLLHLYISSKTDDTETFEVIKKHKISLINQKNFFGATPLMMNFKGRKTTEIIEENLKDIDFKVQDKAGETLLMRMVNTGKLNSKTLTLIKKALDILKESQKEEFIESLKLRDRNGDDLLIALLRQSEIIKDNIEMGFTDSLELIKLLIDLGANPENINRFGKNAFDYDITGSVKNYVKTKFIKDNLK